MASLRRRRKQLLTSRYPSVHGRAALSRLSQDPMPHFECGAYHGGNPNSRGWRARAFPRIRAKVQVIGTRPHSRQRPRRGWPCWPLWEARAVPWRPGEHAAPAVSGASDPPGLKGSLCAYPSPHSTPLSLGGGSKMRSASRRLAGGTSASCPGTTVGSQQLLVSSLWLSSTGPPCLSRLGANRAGRVQTTARCTGVRGSISHLRPTWSGAALSTAAPPLNCRSPCGLSPMPASTAAHPARRDSRTGHTSA